MKPIQTQAVLALGAGALSSELIIGNPFDVEQYLSSNEKIVYRMSAMARIAEYELIKQGKSKLSSSVRAHIKSLFEPKSRK